MGLCKQSHVIVKVYRECTCTLIETFIDLPKMYYLPLTVIP